LCTGKIEYPAVMSFYTGYGDGVGKDVFISDDMRLDWQEHREELMKFWKSGKYNLGFFPEEECVPWQLYCGSADTLPWAAKQFDEGT
jgi:hypothetical protein